MAHGRLNTTNSSTHGKSDSYQSGRSFRRTDFRFVRRMAPLAKGSRPLQRNVQKRGGRWQDLGSTTVSSTSDPYKNCVDVLLRSKREAHPGINIHRGLVGSEQETPRTVRRSRGPWNLRPELTRPALLFHRPCCMCPSNGEKRPCTNRATMSGIQTIWVNFERKADSPNYWKQ